MLSEADHGLPRDAHDSRGTWENEANTEYLADLVSEMGHFQFPPHITNACVEFHTLSFKPDIRLDSGHAAENSKNQKLHVTQKLLQSSLTP